MKFFTHVCPLIFISLLYFFHFIKTAFFFFQISELYFYLLTCCLLKFCFFHILLYMTGFLAFFEPISFILGNLDFI
ncbi:hypothetical protein CW304_17545 [Bacillus sp. UFRGS-B20]|nr:hypothetical protein CW304_17545 [Bacillus sp. UFRGS-B20]